MSKDTNTGALAEVEMRMRAVAELLGRTLPPHPPAECTPEEQHRHLLEEAQQLYENELTWEEETGEESTESGAVVSLVFPGTLALVDALVAGDRDLILRAGLYCNPGDSKNRSLRASRSAWGSLSFTAIVS
jgi:hypothetical protein